MQQVTQSQIASKQTALLDSSKPADQSEALPNYHTQPVAGVLRAIVPFLLPRGWHCALEQGSRLVFDGWCEHLGAVEYANDAHDTFVYLAKDLDNGLDLHEYELVNWVL